MSLLIINEIKTCNQIDDGVTYSLTLKFCNEKLDQVFDLKVFT